MSDKEIKEHAIANNDLYRIENVVDVGTFEIELPIPPSVNSMYIHTRGGKRRLSSIAENYMRDSRALLHERVADTNWKMPNRHTWLYVDLVFYFPDRRIRDASNCLKLLMDVPEGIVYVNDYNALPRVQSVELDNENPRVVMTISPQLPQERKAYVSEVNS